VTNKISRKTLAGAVWAVAAGMVFGSSRAIAKPVANNLSELAASLDGQVIVPSNGAEYATAKGIFNTRYDSSTPVAVVEAKSTTDVQRAISFAAKHNVNITPRSGGHSYIGASIAVTR
jgi:hypothetical protein